MYRRVAAANAVCVANVSDGVLVRVISAHAVGQRVGGRVGIAVVCMCGKTHELWVRADSWLQARVCPLGI